MTWQALNLAADVYSKPSEPPTRCGLIYAGKRHLISGPPEAAKTLLALIFAIEEIRAGGTIAIIDFESGPAETRRLLEDLGATLEEITTILYFEPDAAPTDSDTSTIVEAGVTLAIIDALAGAYDASGFDDEKRRDVERFANTWIKPLYQRSIATIAIDHVVKNHENRGKFSIGSERKLGTVDVHLGLKPVAGNQLHRGSSGLITVSTHKDRPAHLARPTAATVELHSDPITNAITWAFRPTEDHRDSDTPWMPTALMQKVSEYLERQPLEVPVTYIYRDVKGKTEYIRQAVDFLTLSHHITEQRGKQGSRQIRSVKPYRDPFPTLSQPVPEFPVTPFPVVPPPLGGNGKGTQTRNSSTTTTRASPPRWKKQESSHEPNHQERLQRPTQPRQPPTRDQPQDHRRQRNPLRHLRPTLPTRRQHRSRPHHPDVIRRQRRPLEPPRNPSVLQQTARRRMVTYPKGGTMPSKTLRRRSMSPHLAAKNTFATKCGLEMKTVVADV